MKELVVISGKGGTGKTSITAALAVLAKQSVIVDCDVDAADLHLILRPTIEREEEFSGGKKAFIIADACTGCGECFDACRFGAVTPDRDETSGAPYIINRIHCEGCGVCYRVCPADAIDFGPAVNGVWRRSQTPFGPMVHARLGIAEGNSGKLVSLMRQEARRIVEERKLDLIIADGSPGIGCPVISSITGADHVLVVTEPTLSGRHDMERVSDLTAHFGITTTLCINKWDLNSSLARDIEQDAVARGIETVGRVRYDKNVTASQIENRTVIEHGENGAAQDIVALWQTLKEKIR